MVMDFGVTRFDLPCKAHARLSLDGQPEPKTLGFFDIFDVFWLFLIVFVSNVPHSYSNMYIVRWYIFL